jgi:D-alanyl-D-alanine carboxypeptidase
MKRQHSLGRRSVTTAIIAAALAAGGVTVHATPAQAAIPDAAKSWSYLMVRSLTVTATATELRRTLAVQRSTVRTRTAALTEATTADAAARRRVTTATTTDTAAKDRVATARQVLSAARKTLKALSPRTTAAVTRAQNAVTAGEKTLYLRNTQAREAATVLSAAKASAATAATTLSKTTAALKYASTAVTVTQQKITNLKTPAELAAQAAGVSRNAVSAVRLSFTTADTGAVYGTTVHLSVAYSYRRMVDDAKKAGISISGGGFRTKQRQIELRKINGCPNVWTAPASSCRVPTAIPGRSLHEIGMAIDITSGGRSLTSSSPAFKWLKLNGAKYGFFNLPSEPWHWSITGG